MDAVAEICLPRESVVVVACCRKGQALNLVALYWSRRPWSPVLVEKEGGYAYVLCGRQDEQASWGPWTLSTWRTLLHEDKEVSFACPKAPINPGGGACALTDVCPQKLGGDAAAEDSA
jgi:hypothetical protein